MAAWFCFFWVNGPMVEISDILLGGQHVGFVLCENRGSNSCCISTLICLTVLASFCTVDASLEILETRHVPHSLSTPALRQW